MEPYHHPGVPLCRGSPALQKRDLQFSSLVHDFTYRLINTKDRVRRATFTRYSPPTTSTMWKLCRQSQDAELVMMCPYNDFLQSIS